MVGFHAGIWCLLRACDRDPLDSGLCCRLLLCGGEILIMFLCHARNLVLFILSDEGSFRSWRRSLRHPGHCINNRKLSYHLPMDL